MKCYKCKAEIENNSKFCNNCGAKLEEKPLEVQFEDSMKTCCKTWFLLGYLREHNKDNEKKIKEFEVVLRNLDGDIWKIYLEVLEFWKDWLKDKKQVNKESKEQTNSK